MTGSHLENSMSSIAHRECNMMQLPVDMLAAHTCRMMDMHTSFIGRFESWKGSVDDVSSWDG